MPRVTRASAAAGPAAPSRKAKGLLKGAVTTKKEKSEATVKTQRRKYQKSAAQQKKEAEAKKKRLAETRKKSAREKKSEKAAPVRATRSTRSASATTKSATTRSKRKRAGDSSDSSSSALSDVESPVAKRRKDARRILEAETERKRAQRAKEQADAELRAAQKAAKELEQKAREAAVRAEAAARAAEAARTPAKSPRGGGGGGGGGGGDAPVEMWKVYICWRDEELPVKIRSDATVGSLAWLISSKTDGKLQADRCELTFGVTKLASVPSQELLATIGVVQGARFGLTLRPKGAGARQAPSPVLSPRAKAAAKARLEAARGVERAAMASLDEVSRYRTASGRAPNQSWTEPEALALVDGVAAFGLGEWAKILDAVWLKHVDFPKRSATDLKDKWRNLCNSADKPAGFKFRLAYVTPELLARTRDVRAETQRKRREDDDKWEAEAAARRAEIRRRSLNA